MVRAFRWQKLMNAFADGEPLGVKELTHAYQILRNGIPSHSAFP